ncbi:cysteine hydrolase [Candidatus Obscuribacterales bacterium]|nr:cysteine hydrolase [Candidatus Obscuribacterales bacterium]
MHSKAAENHNTGREKSDWALLIIDVINDLNFPGNEHLVEASTALADRILDAKKIARNADIPIIYVNDNFNKWRSNWEEIFDHVQNSESLGAELARKLKPDEHDYFVIKPMHSAFYGTPLDILLSALGSRRLIMAGLAADICVMYSANDAYMRGFEIVILIDCVESNFGEEKERALKHMKERLKANLVSVDQLAKFLSS